MNAVIEKGMDDGAEITFPRMSEQRPGMIPGDVVFKVRVKEHDRFTRRGNHLHMQMEISLGEALLGFEKTVLHLDGREVKIKEKGITHPYDTKTIKGEGMPQHDVSSVKGDLHIKMHVNFPRQLTKAQREFIQSTGWL